MKGQLKDLATNALLADVPTTVNLNNKVLKNEFDNIFDASNDYLTQSLYAPNGTVKSHWGEFVNLRVSNLVIDNTSSSDSTNIEHSDTEHRFSWQLSKLPKLDVSEILNYAHDTKMIITYADASTPLYIGAATVDYPITLRTELDAIENILTSLSKNISVKMSDGSLFVDSAEEFGTNNDPSINGTEISYGAAKTNFVPIDSDDFFVYRQDVNNRLAKIEQRLSTIEEKLGLNDK